jgi:SAM-dependent methyltransferase
MNSFPALAPGIPTDYYQRIFEVEERHWWHVGMREVTAAMLGSRMQRGNSSLLDAGCGTGGFLRWAIDHGSFARAAGADIALAALDLARRRVPEADLRPGALSALPFDDCAFDLVVSHDVLQHVPEADVAASIRELHRVLVPGGTMVMRTNGSRTLRRERSDWRAYDRETLRREIEAAGFAVERVTYANTVMSSLSALRGRVPHAPSDTTDGIPEAPRAFRSAVGRFALSGESRFVARPGRTLPYGHTLVAVVVRPS